MYLQATVVDIAQIWPLRWILQTLRTEKLNYGSIILSRIKCVCKAMHPKPNQPKTMQQDDILSVILIDTANWDTDLSKNTKGRLKCTVKNPQWILLPLAYIMLLKINTTSFLTMANNILKGAFCAIHSRNGHDVLMTLKKFILTSAYRSRWRKQQRNLCTTAASNLARH